MKSQTGAKSVTLLGTKGGPAIRPGSAMPTSILVRMGGQTVLVDAGLGAAAAHFSGRLYVGEDGMVIPLGCGA